MSDGEYLSKIRASLELAISILGELEDANILKLSGVLATYLSRLHTDLNSAVHDMTLIRKYMGVTLDE